MTSMGSIASWNPGRGPVTTWTVSPRSLQALRTAPVDPLPPSAQQAQHLWSAHHGAVTGRETPRLIVAGWDESGVCDIDAMTEAITIHVRRHDTYRSIFEVVAPSTIRRRTLENADVLDVMPADSGFMTAEQVRNHALTSTPGTLAGVCFTFGVVQNDDHFGVYASVDHLHFDGTPAALIFLDIHLSYQALAHGLPIPLPPVSGYRDYTARQHEQTAAATPESPAMRRWIDFAREAGSPGFPLPLGDTTPDNRGGWVTVGLLDAQQTDAFETACRAAGARFSGGVMACAALAAHEVTGATTFHGLTPSDTRCGDAESLSVGWFASLFPVTVPIAEGGDFPATARAAQASFDRNRTMAAVPVQRILELASAGQLGIDMPTRPPMMLSYMDLRKVPAAGLWRDAGFGLYGDDLSCGGVNMWINRAGDRTTVTVSFPDNPEAHRSVQRYLAALSAAFAGAAATEDWIAVLNQHANDGRRCAASTGSR